MDIRKEKKPFRLVYSCDFDIPKIKNQKIQRKKAANYFGENKDCYYEEYYNFEDLKKRLDNIYAWNIKDYPDVPDEKYSYFYFHIENSEEDCCPVGISPYGWLVSLLYSQRLYEYLEEKFGEENLWKMLNLKTDTTQVWFYENLNTEPYIASAYELVSEETASIILKNFLNGKYETDLDPNIYYQEILNSNLKL